MYAIEGFLREILVNVLIEVVEKNIVESGTSDLKQMVVP